MTDHLEPPWACHLLLRQAQKQGETLCHTFLSQDEILNLTVEIPGFERTPSHQFHVNSLGGTVQEPHKGMQRCEGACGGQTMLDLQKLELLVVVSHLV